MLHQVQHFIEEVSFLISFTSKSPIFSHWTKKYMISNRYCQAYVRLILDMNRSAMYFFGFVLYLRLMFSDEGPVVLLRDRTRAGR